MNHWKSIIRLYIPVYVLATVLLYLSNPVFGQQAQNGLTPQHVAKVKSVGDVAISPNGNKIAYTLRVQADPLKENKPPHYELHLLDLLSGESTPYVTTMSVSSIQFRPRYNSITFLGNREGDPVNSVYEISLQGGEAQKLFSFSTSIAGYEWAPDGNYLAFMAPEPKSNGSDSALPYQPEIYEENLTQRRGYVTNVAMEGNHLHRLQQEGSIYQMRWSPDGERLAIAIAPTPLVDDYYMHQQVKIVEHHGDSVLAEINHRGKLGRISWSPNGKLLAMIAGADIHDPIDGRLFVVSAEGGTPNNLRPDYEGKFEQFYWADNNTLNYLASEGVWSVFGKINSDGSGEQIIVNKGGPILRSFSKAENGNVAFTADSPVHPEEVYIMRSGQNELQRMTYSNPWLSEITLGEQEVVSWTSRDSLQLEGLLIHPATAQDSAAPLITVVHGGPESHFSNGWLTSYSQPGQVAAARGYYVFYPNYRGSTGRGEAFAKSSQGDPAGAEFDDIVDGVDAFVDAGIAEPEKIGITGGSYGGYATGWMSTRYTDRFAAGVMFVGISNNISKWGTSDIPEELYLVHARKRIWDDYQFQLERSPIYYAGQAKTPLLIMAGKQDTRVDPGQSYELYRHIKTRTDTPVRLVLYPGEGHGNSRSTARYDYSLRMMRWFDQYLKGEKVRPDTEIEIEVEKVSIQN